jgi:hypothetical protein
MKRALLLSVASLFLAACATKPPGNWVKGGAPLDVIPSRWVRGDTTIEIMPDGKVVANSEHLLSVDRGGRVFDVEAKPVALLEPDGRVIGPDDKSLGFVGAWSASLPDKRLAWLAVMNTGEVVRFGDEGERTPMGVWVGGCGYSLRAHQLCTLVTHLLVMRFMDQRRLYHYDNPWMAPPGLQPGFGHPGLYPGTGL